ncbi:hypothetical protein LOC68_17690 [Blastopirellula sp. JC732]|uniref:YtkA-like domain-containing protein n=1 Tax=Blastopirellula sediminis TaxID=2894196 RepID=A0A9X1MPZ4_9BACT|nr:hypothetical protein [Blastopirellula sediminis]MCC9606472.1 hypothetical protein [Blastopirellula sediminis]MCC9630230.1 hypothetical protein [Blastopirellula sediminis]
MSPVCKSIAAIALLLAVANIVLADGGKVQLRREVAPYQVTIFTSPTPLRAGPVDLSILVQDAAGNVVNDIQIDFRLKSESGVILTPPASQATSTNKLLQSAKFILPEKGAWQVQTTITGKATADIDFEIIAAEARSDWGTAGWMLLLPMAIVALFVMRERLVQRQRSEE